MNVGCFWDKSVCFKRVREESLLKVQVRTDSVLKQPLVVVGGTAALMFFCDSAERCEIFPWSDLGATSMASRRGRLSRGHWVINAIGHTDASLTLVAPAAPRSSASASV